MRSLGRATAASVADAPPPRMRVQVDALEERRNSRVYEWQFNRNPFVDNPAWVETLWGSACRRR
jgi:hypothetical protein